MIIHQTEERMGEPGKQVCTNPRGFEFPSWLRSCLAHKALKLVAPSPTSLSSPFSPLLPTLLLPCLRC